MYIFANLEFFSNCTIPKTASGHDFVSSIITNFREPLRGHHKGYPWANQDIIVWGRPDHYNRFSLETRRLDKNNATLLRRFSIFMGRYISKMIHFWSFWQIIDFLGPFYLRVLLF